MKLLRSWPRTIPTGRSFVIDATKKLIIDDYDYSPLADIPDDVILLEWDIAVGRDDLELFVATARADPARVIVAPYRLYVTTAKGHPLRKPVWCHRRADGHHIDTGEPTCALFGLGMVYLPHKLVLAFMGGRRRHFSDGSFSGWHRREVTDAVPIIWEARPAHLHYPVDELGLGAGAMPVDHPWVRRMTHQPPPEVDERAAERATDPIVAALLVERASLTRSGKLGRIAAVNEQLALRDYKDDAHA